MKEKILENYLKQDDFDKLKNFLLGDMTPWYYKEVSSENSYTPSEYFFKHSFYNNYQVATTNFYLIKPFIDLIKPKAIVEIEARLYPKTKEVIVYPESVDQKFKHKGALFYVNSNDGCTYIDNGTSINSVENRMAFFDTYDPYSDTSCTDENCRVVISFNYF